MEKYRKVGVKYTKENPGDVVTEADLASNDFIIEQIKRSYPSHGILSEETGADQADKEWVWIIDPLDGTRNFATHTPMFGTMVALTRNNVPEMAAIFDPVHDELAFAQRTRGAYKNGIKVHCSQKTNLEFSYGCGSALTSGKNYAIKRALLDESRVRQHSINDLGTIAIPTIYVADGRRDWKISKGGKVWDYTPAALILREAGCKVTNLEGNPWTMADDNIIAANDALHQQLVGIIKSIAADTETNY